MESPPRTYLSTGPLLMVLITSTWANESFPLAIAKTYSQPSSCVTTATAVPCAAPIGQATSMRRGLSGLLRLALRNQA